MRVRVRRYRRGDGRPLPVLPEEREPPEGELPCDPPEGGDERTEAPGDGAEPARGEYEPADGAGEWLRPGEREWPADGAGE